MMDNKEKNAVRNHLMNTLGMSRDTIREEMKEIIEQEVSKRIGTGGFFDAFLREIVTEEVKRVIRNEGKRYDSLTRIATDEITKNVKRMLNGMKIVLPEEEDPS